MHCHRDGPSTESGDLQSSACGLLQIWSGDREGLDLSVARYTIGVPDDPEGRS